MGKRILIRRQISGERNLSRGTWLTSMSFYIVMQDRDGRNVPVAESDEGLSAAPARVSNLGPAHQPRRPGVLIHRDRSQHHNLRIRPRFR